MRQRSRRTILIGMSFFIILQLTRFTSSAQTSGLRGVVLNSETGAPVGQTYLILQKAGEGTAGQRSLSLDDDGMFLFSRLSAGNWMLRVTRAGYKPLTIDVQLFEGAEQDLIVYFSEVPYETTTVVVTGSHRHSSVQHEHELNSTLRGKDLDRELGLSLAATLRNETGLAMRSMGPAPARPVIRGLGGDRVFISEDGFKTVDLSATSPDHAVTIEPFGAERIEVLRGPRVLTKGPTTIGGVVNVVRHDIPIDPHRDVIGSIGLYGETANRGYLGSVLAEGPISPFLFRGEASRRESGDLRTPEGELRNSDSRTFNWTLGGSVIREAGMLGAAHRQYTLSYGVPGGFVGAHPNGVNIEMERRQTSARGNFASLTPLFHDLSFTAARTYYRHKEFEASGLIGSEFLIVDWQGTVQANHHGFDVIDEGIAGMNASHRDITFGGYVFTSPGTAVSLAPFLYERFHFGSLSVETAVRFNYDRIAPRSEKPEARIGHIRERVFDTWSASMSILYPVGEVVRIGANLSRSSRVPTIEELFSEGPHLAAYSYEVGNPDLEAEHGYGAELFVTHHFDGLSWTIAVFRNDLSSFIIPRNTGEINYSTFLPIYRTSGVEALFYGVEAQANVDVHPSVRIETSISWTHGNFQDTGQPLPLIPPLKARIGAIWRSAGWQTGLSIDAAARQGRVDTFEESTAGYAIFHAFAQYSIVAGSLIHNVSLNGDNLLDRSYRNHLSRVKSIIPEAGISLRATYKLHFAL